jgi:hypothetical protein
MLRREAHNEGVKMCCALAAIALYTSICAGVLALDAEGQAVRKANATSVQAQAGSLVVMDICDALQNIDKLSGSVVAVRGYYRFGMELGGLYGRNCPKKLVLDGATRGQAFDLSYGPMVDDKALAAVANRLIEEKNIRAAIQATVVGVVRARRPDLIDIDGRKARMFGHLGVYPAQIIVQALRDVSVVDAPDFPSNMDPNRRL